MNAVLPHHPRSLMVRRVSAAVRVGFEELRHRAFELADSGHYRQWGEIGAAMEAEGHEEATRRLRSDPILTRMLDARCEQARSRL